MANEYELNKLINTVNRQSQQIEVLIRKVEELTKAVDDMTSDSREIRSHG